MKKSYSNFLRTPLRAGMPMLVAACFAVTSAVAAADVPPPQPEKAPVTPAGEVKAHAREFKEIRDLIAEAEKLANTKVDGKVDFDSAMAKLEAAGKLLAEKQRSSSGNPEKLVYLEELNRRYEATRAAIGVLSGEAMYQDAKALYEEAVKAGLNADSAAKAQKAKDIAEEARYIFYMAPVDRKAGRDMAALDDRINPRNQDFSIRVSQLMAACDKIISAFKMRSETDTAAVDPDYANRMERIAKLYTQATNLYRKAQYTQARDLCEQIFVEDPYNAKATALLDKIYKKLYFYSELRAYNEILRSDAEIIWLWSNAAPSPGDRVQETTEDKGENPLMEKLDSWKISISFKDYTIRDAIAAIRELSKDVDPRHVGINPVERGVAGTDTENVRITLELEDTPISVILNYLCKMAGISWKVDDTFIYWGHGISDYETRDIPMRNSTYNDKIVGSGDEEGEGEDEDEGEAGAWGARGIDSIDDTIANAGKRPRVASDKKLKAYFEERGITFDSNSFIIYDRKHHKLTVTNTRENLQKLEVLVREIDVETPLVLIESKILEIAVNDEEELGFDWSATYTNDKNSDYNFAFNSPLRAIAPSAVNPVDGIINDKLLNNLNIIPNMNLNGGHQLNFYLTISAVDRTDRLEQLSTPKVVVRDTEEATIKMIRRMYFPDSWESPDTEIDDGDVAMETAYPEFGEPMEVGIEFRVTPAVSSNKYTIQLDIAPTIKDLTGWTDYSYDMVIRRDPFGDDDDDDDDTAGGEILAAVKNAAVSTDLFRVNIKMPEISRRELVTKLKCYDAQTMMVGGMVLDKQVSMEDRYPILGDLPLIGRLFTKTSSSSARSNLLISVTPRLISGDGVPVNSRPGNGLPDFRFRK